jgi:hypothetical protein
VKRGLKPFLSLVSELGESERKMSLLYYLIFPT